MRILFLSLLLAEAALAQCSSPCIASTSAGSIGGAPVTTPAIDTTGAGIIILVVADLTGNATVTDSANNTWAVLTAQYDGFYGYSRIYYALTPATSAVHTFTASGASSIYPTLSVEAFSGSWSYASLQNGTSGASTTHTGSVTPGVNNCLIVAGVENSAINVTGIDSGFSSPVYTNAGAGNHFGGGICYLVQTAAAAVNPLWTTLNSDTTAGVIAVFQAASVTGTKRRIVN